MTFFILIALCFLFVIVLSIVFIPNNKPLIFWWFLTGLISLFTLEGKQDYWNSGLGETIIYAILPLSSVVLFLTTIIVLIFRCSNKNHSLKWDMSDTYLIGILLTITVFSYLVNKSDACSKDSIVYSNQEIVEKYAFNRAREGETLYYQIKENLRSVSGEKRLKVETLVVQDEVGQYAIQNTFKLDGCGNLASDRFSMDVSKSYVEKIIGRGTHVQISPKYDSLN